MRRGLRWGAALALNAGFPPERILMHGNAKSEAELRMALEHRIGLIVIDNFDEIDRLGDSSILSSRRMRRLAGPCMHGGTTSHATVVFRGGGGRAACADRATPTCAATRTRRSPPVRPTPSSVFRWPTSRPRSSACGKWPGSSSRESMPTSAPSFWSWRRFGARPRRWPDRRRGGRILHLRSRRRSRRCLHRGPASARDRGVGGGAYRRRARGWDRAGHAHPGRAGRALTANAGVTLYTVESVKRNVSTWVAVDGGMSDNLRPMLYGAAYEAHVADRLGRSRSAAAACSPASTASPAT